jgi:hypothetical protein
LKIKILTNKTFESMKKNFKYAFMSAIAFVGAVSFSACSSSDEIVDNPDYNPETNMVKTAITLSIDPNGSSITRMAAGTVQVGTSTFRGIQDIWLIPASAEISGTISTTSRMELGTINNIGGFDNDKESQKTYTDKEVPVTTTNFLFLGKASQGTLSTVAQKMANGYTTNNIGSGTDFTAGTVGEIKINAVGIAPTSGATPALTTDWTTPANNIADYLTSIANVAGWSATQNANLSNIYNNFTSTNLKAGSSAAVLLTLQSLYNAVEGADATISLNIQSAITNANLQVKSGTTAPAAELEWVSSPDILTDFPVNLGLPEGAAQYQWNSSNTKFEYVTDPTLNAANTAVMNIIYPDELYYLTSTTLKASDSKTVTWPKSVATWTSEAWSGWGSSVLATSKNIALMNNIQYGTAMLSSTVRAQATKLYDNAKALDPEQTSNSAIDVTSTTFPLTGVLVGGQPSSVEWNFVNSSTTEAFNKVVYDNNVPSGIYAGSQTESAKNYTLVFDNLRSGDQSDVSVCLEFENNSNSDFWGRDGLILKGQKFYIVGKLVLGTSGLPYPTVGETLTTAETIASATASYYPSLTPRIFIQDFETTAKFELTAGDANTAGSLGKAFATIPDLRSSNQTLGLSVDLNWTPGLTFTVNLGE